VTDNLRLMKMSYQKNIIKKCMYPRHMNYIDTRKKIKFSHLLKSYFIKSNAFLSLNDREFLFYI
jgi:hypothetical protein